MTLLPDGRVLAVGGREEDGSYTDLVEAFDPESSTWSEVARLQMPRAGHSVVLAPDGIVAVVGGAPVSGSVEILDSTTGVLSAGPSIDLGFQYHSSVTLDDGRLLLGGGSGEDSPVSSRIGIYDPEAHQWSVVKSMTFSRLEHAYSLLNNGSVLVTGGRNLVGPIDDAELYDPEKDEWVIAGAAFNQ